MLYIKKLSDTSQAIISKLPSALIAMSMAELLNGCGGDGVNPGCMLKLGYVYTAHFWPLFGAPNTIRLPAGLMAKLLTTVGGCSPTPNDTARRVHVGPAP